MKKKFRKGLFGGYVYNIYFKGCTFVSKPFKTPLEALTSFKTHKPPTT